MKKKSLMKYAVGFMSGEDELWIKDIRKFYLAKQYAEMLGGTVFLQHPEYGVTDAIWPKQPQMFTWADLNDCFLHLARIKKDPPQPMFNYRIKWVGCNGAGEQEEGVEYDGNNRMLALAAIKRAKDWMGYYGILSVRGREKIKAEKERAKLEEDLGIDECFLDDPPCYEAGIKNEVCTSCEYDGCIMHPCKC